MVVLQALLCPAGLGHHASASEEGIVAVARVEGGIPGMLGARVAQLSVIWPGGISPRSSGMADVKQVEANLWESGTPFIQGFRVMVTLKQAGQTF